MSATGRGGATEPGRALRAPTTPGAVLAATDGGERVCFSSPLGSQCGGCSSLRTPGPLPLYRGPCPPAVGTALLATRLSFGLVSGGEERLDRAKPGDTRHPRPTVCNRHQSQGEQIMSEGAPQ